MRVNVNRCLVVFVGTLLVVGSTTATATHPTRVADISTVMSGCKNIFLDVGCNDGSGLLAFSRPALTHAGVPSWLQRLTSGTAFRLDQAARQDFCVIGIEPNPLHTPGLNAVEKLLRRQGVNAIVLTEVAASTMQGEATLYIDNLRKGSVGSSMSPFVDFPGASQTHKVLLQQPSQNVTVETVDFSLILHEVEKVMAAAAPVNARHGRQQQQQDKGLLVVRMDVEGAEFPIFSKLLLDGRLCVMNAVIVEWHSWLANSTVDPLFQGRSLPEPSKFIEMVEWLARLPHCGVTFLQGDLD